MMYSEAEINRVNNITKKYIEDFLYTDKLEYCAMHEPKMNFCYGSLIPVLMEDDFLLFYRRGFKWVTVFPSGTVLECSTMDRTQKRFTHDEYLKYLMDGPFPERPIYSYMYRLFNSFNKHTKGFVKANQHLRVMLQHPMTIRRTFVIPCDFDLFNMSNSYFNFSLERISDKDIEAIVHSVYRFKFADTPFKTRYTQQSIDILKSFIRDLGYDK